ncbi:MAG: DNA polymerase III subunit delta [Candidatus Riflebacteria bacterium GWC2_50_8]|nr:MAG: DNA polymerase III subunit delta [Candidatus Riflebacteria bacterium GWC2_50_8]
MDLATFEKQLKTGKISNPVLVFAGPEDFLKEKAFSDMIQSLVPETDRQDNVVRAGSNAKELPGVIQQIFSFTFNESPRLFLIQEIDSATAKQRKDFLERLANGGIPADTYLVFIVSDAKVAGEIAGKFKQQSDRIDFWAPFANQLGAWIKRQTAEQGAEISNEAADQLIELVGSDLAMLHQELSKLALSSRGKKIGLAEVKAGVAYLRQNNVFDFLEAFGQRSPIKALRCLETLINSGEAAPKLWFMLCRQLRDFKLLHALLRDRPDLFEPVFVLLRRYSQLASKSDFKSNQEKKNLLSEIQQIADSMPETLAKAAGLRQPGKLRNLHLALNFTYSELTAATQEIIETDLAFKSGIADPGASLQRFTASFLTSQTG